MKLDETYFTAFVITSDRVGFQGPSVASPEPHRPVGAHCAYYLYFGMVACVATSVICVDKIQQVSVESMLSLKGSFSFYDVHFDMVLGRRHLGGLPVNLFCLKILTLPLRVLLILPGSRADFDILMAEALYTLLFLVPYLLVIFGVYRPGYSLCFEAFLKPSTFVLDVQFDLSWLKVQYLKLGFLKCLLSLLLWSRFFEFKFRSSNVVYSLL
ncbi:hypothetical protein U1Q18_036680 [Sarracenia purpurea var. burkii]